MPDAFTGHGFILLAAMWLAGLYCVARLLGLLA